MKERPILFSAPMVKALLAGTKTVTRRVIANCAEMQSGQPFRWVSKDGNDILRQLSCSYGVPGDRLWVRENLRRLWVRENLRWNGAMAYEADGAHVSNVPADYRAIRDYLPSIFMPRWASRITLELTDVRVERVQDITEADAKAEGFRTVQAESWRDPKAQVTHVAARDEFEMLWDALNGKREGGAYSWAKNPWVWVLTFKRLEK